MLLSWRRLPPRFRFASEELLVPFEQSQAIFRDNLTRLCQHGSARRR